MSGTDKQPPSSPEGESSGGKQPTSVPRSGSGADTALDAMLKRRRMGTSNDDDPTLPGRDPGGESTRG